MPNKTINHLVRKSYTLLKRGRGKSTAPPLYHHHHKVPSAVSRHFLTVRNDVVSPGNIYSRKIRLFISPYRECDSKTRPIKHAVYVYNLTKMSSASRFHNPRRAFIHAKTYVRNVPLPLRTRETVSPSTGLRARENLLTRPVFSS